MTNAEWMEAAELHHDISVNSPRVPYVLLPSREQLVRGAIVGTVTIADCVRDSLSPWFFGEYGFVLENPKPWREPFPVKGKLGIWRCEVPTAEAQRA